MLPKITRPTGTVDIVTDLTLITKSQALSKHLEQLESQPTAGLTETELSKRREELTDLRESLKTLVEQINAATIVLHMTGLNSSQWEQIVAENTTTTNGQVKQDMVGIVCTAVPIMTDKITWRTGKQDEIEHTQDDLRTMLSEMPDSQLFSILPTVQRLNTPVVALPKA